MKYKKISLKKYLKILRKEPKKALEILGHRKDFAKEIWKERDKWIYGSSPLHWAAHDGNLSLVKRLIKLGADVNADSADWWCRPIDWAADSGKFTVVEYLIRKGAKLDGDKWSNCTPLHVVAQGGSTNGKKNAKDYKKTAKVLIKAGAAVNGIVKYGNQPPALTPLDEAKNVGNKVVEKVLLKCGGKRFTEL